jgi:hypothetical protein
VHILDMRVLNFIFHAHILDMRVLNFIFHVHIPDMRVLNFIFHVHILDMRVLNFIFHAHIPDMRILNFIFQVHILDMRVLNFIFHMHILEMRVLIFIFHVHIHDRTVLSFMFHAHIRDMTMLNFIFHAHILDSALRLVYRDQYIGTIPPLSHFARSIARANMLMTHLPRSVQRRDPLGLHRHVVTHRENSVRLTRIPTCTPLTCAYIALQPVAPSQSELEKPQIKICSLARVGTSKHTPGANVCVSSEVWATVGENCVELCSSGCRPASVGQL